MRRGGRAILALAGMLAAGCGSDEFNPVGSSLPSDVSQDSLRIELFPPPLLTGETAVVPALDQPFVGREILYLGSRERGGWRAVPMFRFDFSAGLPADVDLLGQEWSRAEIQLKMLRSDKEKGILRTVAVYELTDTLDADLATAEDLQALLGEQIAQVDLLSTTNVNLPLPREKLESWITAGAHPGVVLVDLSTQAPDSLDSDMVGLAGKEFTRFASLLEALAAGETAIPEIVIEVAGEFVAYPILMDLTHFERDAPASPLRLGSHLAHRCWLQFDLSGEVVPSNATVNRALLELHVDPRGSLGENPLDLTAYRASEEVALGGDKTQAESILRGASSVDPLEDYRMRVDITEYVQRAVNGVLEPGDGILLALGSETLFLGVVDFYDATALEDSLRPRLSVTYTPPADFQE